MTLWAFARMRCCIADRPPTFFRSGDKRVRKSNLRRRFRLLDSMRMTRIALLRDFLGPRTNIPVDSIQSII